MGWCDGMGCDGICMSVKGKVKGNGKGKGMIGEGRGDRVNTFVIERGCQETCFRIRRSFRVRV